MCVASIKPVFAIISGHLQTAKQTKMADFTLLWHGLLLTHDLLLKTAFCEDFISFESVSNEGISIFLEINSIFIHSWLDQINLDLFFFSGFQLDQNLS